MHRRRRPAATPAQTATHLQQALHQHQATGNNHPCSIAAAHLQQCLHRRTDASDPTAATPCKIHSKGERNQRAKQRTCSRICTMTRRMDSLKMEPSWNMTPTMLKFSSPARVSRQRKIRGRVVSAVGQHAPQRRCGGRPASPLRGLITKLISGFAQAYRSWQWPLQW